MSAGFALTLVCYPWKNVSCKKDRMRSENRVDFFAFFIAQPSSSEGLSADTEGDSATDGTAPISLCT